MSRRKSIFAISQENQTKQKLKEEFMSQQIDQNLRILMSHYAICDSVIPHFAKVIIFEFITKYESKFILFLFFSTTTRGYLLGQTKLHSIISSIICL